MKRTSNQILKNYIQTLFFHHYFQNKDEIIKLSPVKKEKGHWEFQWRLSVPLPKDMIVPANKKSLSEPTVLSFLEAKYAEVTSALEKSFDNVEHYRTFVQYKELRFIHSTILSTKIYDVEEPQLVPVPGWFNFVHSFPPTLLTKVNVKKQVLVLRTSEEEAEYAEWLYSNTPSLVKRYEWEKENGLKYFNFSPISLYEDECFVLKRYKDVNIYGFFKIPLEFFSIKEKDMSEKNYK
ncbi:hypothetical protein bcgnr5372_41500 [Bacillus luti]|nr:hypothetical protein [Bacillus cereus]HDR8328881.1 hypothetical protein [Bacillus cereus]HDR8334315.1 hypothetical protein [Bacillus cereus]